MAAPQPVALTRVEDRSSQGADERLNRAVTRMLTTSEGTPKSRTQAIYRVLAADAGFQFSCTLVLDGNRTVERFGPYATQRAAHELARRAAARFLEQFPTAVVGVIDIEPEPEPAPVESYRDRILRERAEAKRARLREKDRRRHARRMATPEGREALRERQRSSYAKTMATPEGRERLRKKWHARPKPNKAEIVCEDERSGIVPACIVCGKPTHYYQGHAVRFCSKQPGEKRSICNTRYSAMLAVQRFRDDPEKSSARHRRDRELRSANPKRYEKYLAQRRAYSARRRAREVATRPSEGATGSVLTTASHRAPGRDLLASVYAAVPAQLPPALRMEIISETAVLVLEGIDLRAAVVQASKSVRRNANLLRNTKPIDDCFWLADESSFSMEAHL